MRMKEETAIIMRYLICAGLICVIVAIFLQHVDPRDQSSRNG